MTQTVNRKTFQAAIFLTSLISLASAATAGGRETVSLCAPGEKVWFSAEVTDSDQLVSLCGAEKVNDRIAWLQFRMGIPGNISLAWPERRKGSTKAFTYRRYTRYRVSLLKLGFRIDGRDYAILDDDVSEDRPIQDLRLRIRRVSDEQDLETYTLRPDTKEGSLMRLEHYVPTKDYDE